jgi:diaminopimelate decarboxylase
VVSEGELRRARQAGIPGGRIVFSGVGKSLPELRLALTENIAQINVESAEELDMLSALAAAMGRTARVALRINPDVDAGTHAKITTGRAQDKFGIPYADAIGLYRRAASLPGIEPVGLAVHIGSQILSLAPYRAAYGRVAELVRTLRASGHQVAVVDCGGGLGIPYCNEPSPGPVALAGVIRGALQGLDVRVVIEPGRWLVGPGGLLLASVVIVKQTQDCRFVVLDAAMNDLVRPAMYDAWHGIVPVSAVDAAAPTATADIVGPVCESADTFARNRPLPPLAANARVAILDAGAYGSVMSSPYNARPAAAEVMVDGAKWSVIRDRQAHADLWRGEQVPDWLG